MKSREHADEKAARRTGAVNRWLQECTLKKVLTTSQKRAAVAAFEEVGVSERKACIAVGLSRATLRHKSTKKDDFFLSVNEKRVYRIYKGEGLQVRKRFAGGASR